MRVNRESFLKQLEAVTPGLAKREIIEQSQCFIFRDGMVTTFNDEILVNIPCSIDAKLTGAVPAEPLLNLLRKLSEDDLDVEQKDGELLVKGKRRRAGIRMEDEIVLPVEGIERPDEWRELPEGFVEAVGIVGTCASADDSLFVLTCVHVHPEWLEASDNDQAVRYPMETGMKKPLLVRWCSLRGMIGLGMTETAVTESWIHFRSPSGLVLSCRRNEEDFPKLDGVMEVKGKKTTLPKGLEEAVGKAELFSRDELGDSLLMVELKGDRLKLEGRGPAGWYRELKKVRYGGEPMRFMVAPKLLVEIARRANECVIGENKMMVDTGKFVYVTCTGKVEDD